jgi:D-amino peptidase
VKVFISADMEGVSGIVHPAQCRPTHADYGRFRDLFTEEVNAAVEGAIEGGATAVVVNDAHFTMTNILIEKLHPEAELISGATKLLGQMEGLDESFDGVFFVGYHEGDGMGDGIVNHTLMSATLRRVRVDGVEVDEAALNGRLAAALGVPVVLLTGDDVVCAQAERSFPGIAVAPVKRAIDRLSGQHLAPATARALIRERAAAATAGLSRRDAADDAQPGEQPVRLELEFRSTSAAHCCTLFPGVVRTSPSAVTIEHPSFVEAFRHFWGLAILGMAVQDGVFGTGF